MPLVLGLVPARGGSKGVPDKNVRPFAGKSLLQLVAETAAASGIIDRLVLSTESPAIAEAGRRCGMDVPFMRPPELATDTAAMLPVIEHAVTEVGRGGWTADIVVLLQPTAPLRRPAHIRDAVHLLTTSNADAVASVMEVPKHLSPDYVMRIDNGRLIPFLPEGARITRRQDARPAFVRDGTVYAFWTRTLLDTHSIYGRDCRPLVIAPEDSLTIDSQADWDEAERRVRRRA
jgi:CMP-N-acetylneuraminic acid synthetase